MPTNAELSFYEILEVEENAPIEQITSQYKKLRQQWHPDKNIDNEQEAKLHFQAINEAYKTLKDPDKRAFYDRQLNQSSQLVFTSFNSLGIGDSSAIVAQSTLPLLETLKDADLGPKALTSFALGNESTALFILKDKSILSGLKTGHSIEIMFLMRDIGKKYCACALKIVTENELYEMLSEHFLIEIISCHKKAYKSLLSNEALSEKISGKKLFELHQQFFPGERLAENNPLWRKKYFAYEWIHAYVNKSSQLEIQDDEFFYAKIEDAKLSPDELYELMFINADFAEKILNCPIRKNLWKGYKLLNLCEKHPALLNGNLNINEVLSACYSLTLYDFAKKTIDQCLMILKHPVCSEKLNGEQLFSLSQHYPSDDRVLEAITQDPILLKKLNAYQFLLENKSDDAPKYIDALITYGGEQHAIAKLIKSSQASEKVMLTMLDNERLVNILGYLIISLGSFYQKVADKLLDDPKFFNRFYNQTTLIVPFAKSSVNTCLKILKIEKITDKLTGEDLFKIATHFMDKKLNEVSNLIFSLPSLEIKLRSFMLLSPLFNTENKSNIVQENSVLNLDDGKDEYFLGVSCSKTHPEISLHYLLMALQKGYVEAEQVVIPLLTASKEYPIQKFKLAEYYKNAMLENIALKKEASFWYYQAAKAGNPAALPKLLPFVLERAKLEDHDCSTDKELLFLCEQVAINQQDPTIFSMSLLAAQQFELLDWPGFCVHFFKHAGYLSGDDAFKLANAYLMLIYAEQKTHLTNTYPGLSNEEIKTELNRGGFLKSRLDNVMPYYIDFITKEHEQGVAHGGIIFVLRLLEQLLSDNYLPSRFTFNKMSNCHVLKNINDCWLHETITDIKDLYSQENEIYFDEIRKNQFFSPHKKNNVATKGLKQLIDINKALPKSWSSEKKEDLALFIYTNVPINVEKFCSSLVRPKTPQQCMDYIDGLKQLVENYDASVPNHKKYLEALLSKIIIGDNAQDKMQLTRVLACAKDCATVKQLLKRNANYLAKGKNNLPIYRQVLINAEKSGDYHEVAKLKKLFLIKELAPKAQDKNIKAEELHHYLPNVELLAECTHSLHIACQLRQLKWLDIFLCQQSPSKFINKYKERISAAIKEKSQHTLSAQPKKAILYNNDEFIYTGFLKELESSVFSSFDNRVVHRRLLNFPYPKIEAETSLELVDNDVNRLYYRGKEYRQYTNDMFFSRYEPSIIYVDPETFAVTVFNHQPDGDDLYNILCNKLNVVPLLTLQDSLSLGSIFTQVTNLTKQHYNNPKYVALSTVMLLNIFREKSYSPDADFSAIYYYGDKVLVGDVAIGWVLCKTTDNLYLVDTLANRYYFLMDYVDYQAACRQYGQEEVNNIFAFHNHKIPVQPENWASIEAKTAELKEILNANPIENIGTIKTLIEQSANVNTKNSKGYSAAHYAAYTNNIELINLLISIKANLDLQCNQLGQAPMHCAKSFEMVRLLFKNEALLFILDTNGRQALDYLLSENILTQENLEELLQIALDNLANNKKQIHSALHLETYIPNGRVIKGKKTGWTTAHLRVSRSFDKLPGSLTADELNEQDNDGNTPLFYAKDFYSAFLLTTVSGINCLIKNNQQETALDFWLKTSLIKDKNVWLRWQLEAYKNSPNQVSVELMIRLIPQDVDTYQTLKCGYSIFDMAAHAGNLELLMLLLAPGLQLVSIETQLLNIDKLNDDRKSALEDAKKQLMQDQSFEKFNKKINKAFSYARHPMTVNYLLISGVFLNDINCKTILENCKKSSVNPMILLAIKKVMIEQILEKQPLDLLLLKICVENPIIVVQIDLLKTLLAFVDDEISFLEKKLNQKKSLLQDYREIKKQLLLFLEKIVQFNTEHPISLLGKDSLQDIIYQVAVTAKGSASSMVVARIGEFFNKMPPRPSYDERITAYLARIDESPYLAKDELSSFSLRPSLLLSMREHQKFKKPVA